MIYAQDSIQKKESIIELIQPSSSESCEEIQKKVNEIASRKEFISVSYGLVAAPASSQTAFRAYMLKKYNISFENKGCVVTPQNLCYAAAMEAAIEKEYGKDFISKQYTAFTTQ